MKKITMKLLMFAITLTGMSVLDSCKDYNEDRFNDLEAEISDNKQDLQDLIAGIKECKCDNEALKAEILDKVKEAYATKDMIKEWALMSDVKTMFQDYKKWEDTEKEIDSKLNDYYTKTDLDQKLDDYAKTEDIKTQLQAAVDAKAWVDANKVWIDEHQQWFTNYKDTIEGMTAYVDSLADVAEKNFNTAIALANQIKDELTDSIDSIKANLADLKAQVEKNTQDIKDLSDKIDELTDRVSAVEKSLANLVTGILIQGTENPVYGTFALPANISSNVLIAYYGKAQGSITFPTYIDGDDAAQYIWPSQILTAKEWSMISGVSQYTEADQSPLINTSANSAGKLYVTINPAEVDFDGLNVYLENSQAVAPGIELSPLRKSDKTLTFGFTRSANNGFYEADAKIANIDAVQKINLEKSAFVDIAKDVISNPKSFNYANVAKTIYDQFNGILDANAVKTTYKAYEIDATGAEVEVERNIYSNYALAATAVQPLSFGFAKDFAGGITTLPKYDLAEKIIDKFTKAMKNKLKSLLPGSTYDNTIKLSNITFTSPITGDPNQYAFTAKFSLNTKPDKVGCPNTYDVTQVKDPVVTFDPNAAGAPATIGCVIDGGSSVGDVYVMWTKIQKTDGTYEYVKTSELYWGNDGSVECLPDGKFAIKVSSTQNLTPEFKEVCDAIESAVKSMDDSVKDINDFLDEINSLIGYINNMESKINDASDAVGNLAQKFLDKVNDLGIKAIDKAISSLQPCLVIEDTANDKIFVGQNIVSAPTEVGSTVTLVPTSFTSEIISPAFKKHIACVDVISGSNSAQGGNATLKAELDNVNAQSDMNTVLDGTVNKIGLTLKSGYTYQFAYSAVDYSGKICTKRAAILVK